MLITGVGGARRPRPSHMWCLRRLLVRTMSYSYSGRRGGGGRGGGRGPNRRGGGGRGRGPPPGLSGREIGMYYKERSQAMKKDREKKEVWSTVLIIIKIMEVGFITALCICMHIRLMLNNSVIT